MAEEDVSRPVSELIRERRSVRTFQKRGLERGKKRKLASYIRSVQGLGIGKTRLVLIDNEDGQGTGRLGTYGVIRGARYFVASVVPQGDAASLLELGFRLEKTVLYAVSLGLGACWLGGTFNRGQFAKAAGLAAGEQIPAVVPVGYAADKSLIERLMRKTAGSEKRKDWKELFF